MVVQDTKFTRKIKRILRKSINIRSLGWGLLHLWQPLFIVYRGLVARGPAGSAIKRIADEAILMIDYPWL